MLCATAHRDSWWSVRVFNAIFFWHHNHCQRCWLYEEKEMQHEMDLPSQEWEFDFSNPPRIPPPSLPLLTCQHKPCGKELPQPFFVTKHHGRHTMQYSFCDEACANEFYLEHLRSGGL